MPKKHTEIRDKTSKDMPPLKLPPKPPLAKSSFAGLSSHEHDDDLAPFAGQMKKGGDRSSADTAFYQDLKQEFGDPDLGMEKQQEIFLRGIIHDVNNNLMAVLAACDQLEFYTQPSLEQKEIAVSIRAQVKSITSSMRDILANRNMDKAMRMDEVELKSFLKGIMPSLSLVAGRNTKIELGDFSIPPVMVHPLLLHRVLLQLIRNVGELPVEYPLAFITARRLQSWCEISVSDNGPGISGIDPDEVFLSGYTSKADQGTRGYGLSAVAWAVNNWGGEYGVDHIAGDTGCRFWVRLPLWTEEES